MAEIAKCPKCSVSIDESLPYSWCAKCGEPLPKEIRAKLPALIAIESYALPSTAVPSSPPVSFPHALYDERTVGIATFLGSPLAGIAVIAINYKRTGNQAATWRTLIAGVLITILLFLLPTPPISATLPISFWLAVGTSILARELQGSVIEAHRRAGGKHGSRWFGAGIGIVVALFLSVVLILAGGLSMEDPAITRTRLQVGGKDEIYYSGTATGSDAHALATVLTNIQFFQDRGSTVQLSKGHGGTMVSFTVVDGTWNNPEMVAQFDVISREIAPSIGGLPLTLRLLDRSGDVQKELLIQ
jgi:hypothetical protein